MKREQVYEKLNEVFREVFDDPSISVSDATCAGDIDGWDSLMHITLIAAIEDAFEIVFAMKDIVGMKSVGDMVDLILDTIN